MPPYGCRNTASAHATQGVFINQTAEPIAIAAGPAARGWYGLWRARTCAERLTRAPILGGRAYQPPAPASSGGECATSDRAPASRCSFQRTDLGGNPSRIADHVIAGGNRLSLGGSLCPGASRAGARSPGHWQ